jgi:hypothetical protein
MYEYTDSLWRYWLPSMWVIYSASGIPTLIGILKKSATYCLFAALVSTFSGYIGAIWSYGGAYTAFLTFGQLALAGGFHFKFKGWQWVLVPVGTGVMWLLFYGIFGPS